MTNLTILLACLSMLESNDNDLAVGKHGERGRYQISKVAWVETYRNAKEFAKLARKEEYSRHAVEKILMKRGTAFKTLFHRDPTPYEIYVLWNAPAQIGHPSKVVAEKAQRFENLVNAKMKGGK